MGYPQREPGDIVQLDPEHMPSPGVAAIESGNLRDWKFFNHGLLFTKAPVRDPEDDPVQQWRGQHDPPPTYIRYALDYDMFVNIGGNANPEPGPVLSWDRVLCAVHVDHWEQLWSYLASCVLRDMRTKFAAVLHWQEWELTAQLGSRGIVTVPVVTFGIAGNEITWRFYGGTGQIVAYQAYSDPDVKKFLAPLFANDVSTLAQRIDKQYEEMYRNLK